MSKSTKPKRPVKTQESGPPGGSTNPPPPGP